MDAAIDSFIWYNVRQKGHGQCNLVHEIISQMDTLKELMKFHSEIM